MTLDPNSKMPCLPQSNGISKKNFIFCYLQDERKKERRKGRRKENERKS